MTATPMPVDPLASVERDLATVGELPIDQQSAVFGEMHRVITEVLATTASRGEPASTAR